MSTAGRVKVVVRSRKVPARTIRLPSGPWPTAIGLASQLGGVSATALPERAVVFESVLDDEHRRVIHEGQKLASDLGLELEVIDESQSGFLRRALSSLGVGGGGLGIVVSPQAGHGRRAPQALLQPV